MKFKVNVDNRTIQTDANGKLAIKLSARQNQGLSFDANGKLIATKAEPVEPSPTSNVNTPGNGIGPASYSPTHALYIVGMNSTVSRHQSYTGNDSFIKSNDGVKMSTVENGIITDGLAYHMLAT
jgi:hypothetical protein